MPATMTQKEVAGYLGVSVRTLATMEENGVIKRLPNLPGARYSTSKVKELAGEGQKTYGQMKAERERDEAWEEVQRLRNKLKEIAGIAL